MSSLENPPRKKKISKERIKRHPRAGLVTSTYGGRAIEAAPSFNYEDTLTQFEEAERSLEKASFDAPSNIKRSEIDVSALRKDIEDMRTVRSKRRFEDIRGRIQAMRKEAERLSAGPDRVADAAGAGLDRLDEAVRQERKRSLKAKFPGSDISYQGDPRYPVPSVEVQGVRYDGEPHYSTPAVIAEGNAEAPEAIPEEILEAPRSDSTPAEQKQALADLLTRFEEKEAPESNSLDMGHEPKKPEEPAEAAPAPIIQVSAPEPETAPAPVLKPEVAPEPIAEPVPKPAEEAVPKPAEKSPELRITPRDALGADREQVGPPTKEQFEQMRAVLNNRNVELDAQAEKLGLLRLFRSTGEWYNKRSVWTKIGVGLGLGAGAALSVPFSSLAAAGFGSLLVGQRVLGGTGMFVKFEKMLEKKHEKAGSWFSKRSEKERAAIAAGLAATYSLVMSAAIGEAVHLASGEITPWVERWVEHFWPQHPHVPENVASSAKVEIKPETTAPGAHAVVPPPEAAQTAALPSVEGGARGYEGMIQDLYKQLHAPGANYVLPADHNSDLYRIMTARPEEIGRVAHLIAADKINVHGVEELGRGFYHSATDASDVIEKGSTLGFDSHGTLSFMQAGHGPAIENATPGLDAHTTPALHDKVAAIKANLAEHAKNFPQDSAESDALNASELVRIHQGVPIDNWDYTHSAPVHPETPAPAPAPEAPAAQPVPTPAPESVMPNPEVPTVPHVEVPAPVEHASGLVNHNGVSIDATQGHVFGDAQNNAYAFGTDYNLRLQAAEEYVKAHPDATVYVQAKDPTMYKGELHPWVFKVIWKPGFFGGRVSLILPAGPPDPSQIGGINTEMFTKQLDAPN